MAPSEVQQQVAAEMEGQPPEKIGKEAAARCDALKQRGLLIEQWSLEGLEIDEDWIGLAGSPTKVHRIQSVVLTGGEYKNVPPTEDGVRDLVHELIEDHTIG
jgi:electron transfer flavoprotein beta subunit